MAPNYRDDDEANVRAQRAADLLGVLDDDPTFAGVAIEPDGLVVGVAGEPSAELVAGIARARGTGVPVRTGVTAHSSVYLAALTREVLAYIQDLGEERVRLSSVGGSWRDDAVTVELLDPEPEVAALIEGHFRGRPVRVSPRPGPRARRY